MSQDFQLIAGTPCLDFVNTLDNRARPERRIELLGNYRDLADWSARTGLVSPAQQRELVKTADARPQQAEVVLKNAIILRETLYRIFARSVHQRRPAPADLKAIDSYLASAFSRLQLQPDGPAFRLDWRRRPSELDCLLWPIVRSATDLLTSPELGLVRECELATCRWLFLDRSKNHTRRWCDMKLCGNRTKAKKFYARQKRG